MQSRCLTNATFPYISNSIHVLLNNVSFEFVEHFQEDIIPTVTYAILGMSVIASLSILMSIFEVIAPRQTRRLLYMFPRIMFTVDLTCLYSASLGVILTPAYMVEEKIQDPDRNNAQHLFIWMFNQLPSYSTLMKIIRY